MASDDDTIYVDVSARFDENAAEQASGKLRDKFKGVGQKIGDAVGSEFGQEFGRAIGQAGGGWDNIAKQAGERLGQAIGGGLKDFLGVDLSGVSDTLNSVFGDATSSVQKLTDSLGSLKQGDAAGSLKGVADALHDIAGDNDASKVLQDVSNKAQPLQEQFHGVKDGIKGVVDDLKDLVAGSPAAVAALGAISDAAAPIAAALLALEGGWLGLNKLRDNIYGAGTPPPPGVDPQKWQDFTHGGPTDPSELFPHAPGLSGEQGLGTLMNPPTPPPTTGPKGPPPPGFSSGGQTLLPPTAPVKPDDLGSLMGGTAGFTAGGGGSHVTLVDAIHPDGGGTVPLIQRPDGTWTSPNPSWAHLIQRESGGNPSIQNNWDSNAAAGDPSRGLFQFTRATWARSGGLKYGPDPGNASPQQQAEIAANLIRSNPSGSDWGAGMPGRESAGGLLSGLGYGTAPAGGNFYKSWYPTGGGASGGAAASPAGFGAPGLGALGGGALGPLPPPTQPNQQHGPISQKQIGSGQGAGISGGGLIGAAEQAGVMAAAIGGFGAGGIAAQAAEQEMNLAVQKGTQAAYALASAPLETLWLGGGQMGAPQLQSPLFGWPGKILGGLIGSQTNLPNTAGSVQPPKQPNQQDQQKDQGSGQPPTGPSGSKDDPIHTRPADGQQGPPQGGATSAANLTAAMATGIGALA